VKCGRNCRHRSIENRCIQRLHKREGKGTRRLGLFRNKTAHAEATKISPSTFKLTCSTPRVNLVFKLVADGGGGTLGAPKGWIGEVAVSRGTVPGPQALARTVNNTQSPLSRGMSECDSRSNAALRAEVQVAERSDWLVGLDLFNAFQNTLPPRIDEDCVEKLSPV
jgi:hypothetical protein